MRLLISAWKQIKKKLKKVDDESKQSVEAERGGDRIRATPALGIPASTAVRKWMSVSAGSPPCHTDDSRQAQLAPCWGRVRAGIWFQGYSASLRLILCCVCCSLRCAAAVLCCGLARVAPCRVTGPGGGDAGEWEAWVRVASGWRGGMWRCRNGYKDRMGRGWEGLNGLNGLDGVKGVEWRRRGKRDGGTERRRGWCHGRYFRG